MHCIKRRLPCLLALSLILQVAGCRKGPGQDDLRAEIQQKLDTHFQAGLFEVTHLVRRGSYPYREEGDERDRLLVYFDADVTFQKDYKLSNWDQLNVGSLVSVLGATPLGVDGVQAKGNHAGDRLHVYGTTAYAKEADGWVSVTHSVPAKARKEGKEPPPESLPYQGRIADLAAVASEFNKLRDPAAMAAFDHRLAAFLDDSQRRLGREKGWLTIATGSPAGEYHLLGEALAASLRQEGQKAYAFASGGSIENAQLVDRGEVLFGFVQNDIAEMAYEGIGLFQERIPTRNLVALCSLYPEAVQVVTLAGSGIATLKDLKGRKVDVGLPGSGARVNAVQVLKAAGISLNDFDSLAARSMDGALAALREGRVDAVFLTSAYPNHALARLNSVAAMRLVPLGAEVVKNLVAEHPFFVAARLPAKTYAGQEEAIATVAVTALLVTHRDTPDVRVKQLLDHLYGHIPALARASVQAYYIAQEKGLAGVSIPVHGAARTFFGAP